MYQDIGYLQHGQGTSGPFRTESVPIRHLHADNWEARFEGRWRKVHIKVKSLHIIYQGKRIPIQIWGV